MTWAAVIGSPVEHSLSPVLHRAAWSSLGTVTDWTYHAYEVTGDTLADFLATREPGMVGLSVTMPLKQSIITHLDAIDPQAHAVGAVNTVIATGNVLTGFNTDIHGIITALTQGRESASLPIGHSPLRAVILGGRATAASALAALGSLGITDIAVVARRHGGPGSVLMAAARLGITYTQVMWNNTPEVLNVINAADIVVSTVPAGVTDDLATRITPRTDATLLDVVYSPWHTRLVDAWLAAGAHVVHGTDMLLHQAAMQVRLMTGRDPETSTMRSALLAATRHQRSTS